MIYSYHFEHNNYHENGIFQFKNYGFNSNRSQEVSFTISYNLVSDRTRDEKAGSKEQLVLRPIVWGVYVKRNREGQNGNIHMAESVTI